MTVASTPGQRSSSTPPFSGHTVVFTGKLASVGRRDARALVERLGGLAADEVTAHTTMLVVGAADSARGGRRSAGPPSEAEKSRKLKRAESFNARTPGQIRVLSEEEFCRLGRLPSNTELEGRYHTLRQIRELDRKSTRLNSSHSQQSRMPSSA